MTTLSIIINSIENDLKLLKKGQIKKIAITAGREIGQTIVPSKNTLEEFSFIWFLISFNS